MILVKYLLWILLFNIFIIVFLMATFEHSPYWGFSLIFIIPGMNQIIKRV